MIKLLLVYDTRNFANFYGISSEASVVLKDSLKKLFRLYRK